MEIIGMRRINVLTYCTKCDIIHIINNKGESIWRILKVECIGVSIIS